MSEIINMEEDFGPDYITIVDDEGQEFELEVLDSLEFKGKNYMAFLPTDMDEDDPEALGIYPVNKSVALGLSVTF